MDTDDAVNAITVKSSESPTRHWVGSTPPIIYGLYQFLECALVVAVQTAVLCPRKCVPLTPFRKLVMIHRPGSLSGPLIPTGNDQR